MNSLLLPNDQYQVEKLVFVNSGNSAYVVLPMHESTALVVDNNQGKSSTLGALKLILLPEENMHKCEKKFSFAGRDGFFTGEQSHHFYFPTGYSYIIAEITNPAGTHCQILHRGRGSKRETLAYERWFVPCAYEEIEHHFFLPDTVSDAKLGEPKRTHWEALPELFSGLEGKKIRTSAELKSFLYNPVNTLANPMSRYAMLPLAEKTTNSEIKALKALLDLAFNMSASDKGGEADVISAIIDHRISSNKKTTDIDLDEIMSQFADLREKGGKLDELRGLEPAWEKSQSNWNNIRAQRDVIRSTYNTLQAAYTQHQESFGDKHENLLRLHESATKAEQTAHQEYRELSTTYTAKQTLEKDSLKRIAHIDNLLEKAKELRGQYPGLADEDIAREIQAAPEDGLEALQAKLEVAQSAELTAKRLAECQGVLKPNIKNDIKRLEDLVNNTTESVFADMSEQAATVLSSLLPDLKSSCGQFSTDGLQAIEAFSGLFDLSVNPVAIEAFPLALAGQFKPFNINDLMEDARQKLTVAREALIDIDKEIVELMRSLSDNNYREKQIPKLEAEINEATEELSVIQQAKGKEADRKDEVEQRKELGDWLSENERQLEILKNAYHEAKDQQSTVKAELVAVKEQRHLLKTVERDLKALAMHDKGLLANADPHLPKDHSSELTLNEIIEGLEGLGSQIDLVVKMFADLISGMSGILLHQAFESVQYVFRQINLSVEDIIEPMDFIGAQFETLDEQRRQLRDATTSFNHYTGQQIAFIDELIKEVSHFEGLINAEFKGMTVSNLENVQIDIVQEESLKQLSKQLKGYTNMQRVDQTVLPTGAFFDAIQSFCADFFDGDSKKIRIRKLIRSIKWQFALNGARETKSQSNGTSGVLNATLVAFLLRQLISAEIDIRLPIVFDEVGSLGAPNFKALKSEIERNGFILLVAGPRIDGDIAAVMGAWIDLGHWTVDRVNTDCPSCTLINTGEPEGLAVNGLVEDELEAL